MPASASAAAVVTLKEDALVCGRAWFDETFRQLDAGIAIDWDCEDGKRRASGTTVCRLEGAARAILTGERTALNFLQTLSATATAAAEFVDSVAGTGTVILDTRKTLPGLRAAQKYAVRCGGASNHRIGLFDAILIKENHIAAMGSIDATIEAARTAAGTVLVEVEVESLEQLGRALASDADRLLLDNFSLEMMREAVCVRDRSNSKKSLEASGGITLDNIRAIAETGVDFISVGAMTKSVRAVDFSLRVV
jgi:nicotinate-nucleotide pyrophosphorylase (carboxylating)